MYGERRVLERLQKGKQPDPAGRACVCMCVCVSWNKWYVSEGYKMFSSKIFCDERGGSSLQNRSN